MAIFANTSCGHEFTDDEGNQEWFDEQGHEVVDEETTNGIETEYNKLISDVEKA